VSEFRFGGQAQARPKDPGDDAAWVDYLYMRVNPAGVQTEWWYHRMGCQRWFRLERNTLNNGASKPTAPKI
jgi:heterotetrameric sarcosine oxidase delta subunit